MSVGLDGKKILLRLIAAVATLLCLLSFLFSCGETGGGETYRISVQSDFKTKYYVNEPLSPGGTLRVYYDVDYYANVPIDASMIEGFDSSERGDCIVTITYQGDKTTVLLRIVDLPAKSVELDEGTLPTAFYKGNPFPSGVTFTAEMEDGTVRRNVPVDASYLNGFDPMTLGEQTVELNYAGAKITFTVTVKEDEMSSLVLDGFEEKHREYAVGASAPCLDDLRLKVLYDSGKYFYADLTLEMISGFDASKGGDYPETAVVTYETVYTTLTCYFPYHVTKTPVRFELGDLPVVLEKNTPFAGQGTIYYDDDTTSVVTLTKEDNAPDYAADTAGDHEVKVTAEGVSDVYRYTVLPAIVDHEVSYTEVVKVGTPFNYKGALFVRYETDESETISFDDPQGRLTFETERFDTAGTTDQILRFRTLEVTMPVRVCTNEEWEEWNAVDHIDVAGRIARTLTEGERLTAEDFVGIDVSVVYRHLGYVNLPLDPSWVTVDYPTEALTEDYVDLPVTISCYGIENKTDLTVRMLSNAYLHRVTGLSVTGLSGVYAVGDALVTDEMTFVAEYGGGSSYGESTPLVSSMISGFDTSQPTENGELKIEYEGYTKVYPYTVITREKAEEVTSIEVIGFAPILFVGDDVSALSVEGVTLKVVCGGGYMTRTVAAERAEGDLLTQAGETRVYVVSGDYRGSVAVKVHPESDKTKVTSIRVREMLFAYVGSAPDLSKTELVVTYGYGVGGEEVISLSAEGVTVSAYADRVGDQPITVYYAGQSAGAFVSVVAASGGNDVDSVSFLAEYKQVFTQGEAFGGVTVVVRYVGGDTENVTVTADMVVGFDTSTVGDNKQATVNCYGTPLPYSYKVVAAPQDNEE